MQAATIGLDIAKQVFQVHGADKSGKVLFRRKLRRGEVARFFAELGPCLVGMEASGSAHYWARVLTGAGHTVRLQHLVGKASTANLPAAKLPGGIPARVR